MNGRRLGSSTTSDVIIVGAGSSGCVLAARLSEDPDRSVVLIEAGPDYPSEQDLPPEIRRGFNPTGSHDWGFVSDAAGGVPAIALLRGRLVGGCSATNAAIALRPTREDCDEWAALGNTEWSYKDVLPSCRRLERDADFADGWHGTGGPIPIRRYRDEELVPGQREFLEACNALGFPRVADHNAPGACGAGLVPVNTRGGVRQSTALTYLAAARTRPNLTIRPETLVDRVEFDGARAVGVRLEDGTALHAGAIVLAAGAFGSPSLLLRSGIGPAGSLRALNIPVRRELAGVGENLIDHPRFGVRYAAARPATDEEQPGCQVVLTWRSNPEMAGHDLHIFPWSVTRADENTSPTGGVMTVHVAVMKPRSRGRLRLVSADPRTAPRIEPGYLSDPADLPRLVAAVEIVRRLAATPPFSGIALRELVPGDAIRSPAAIGEAIRAGLRTYFHPVGTCRMGPAGDPLAVVDGRGRVHGFEGLLVADASIAPAIPAANTNLMSIMIAERCAEWLR